MKILCVFGRYNYGDPARGESYEYMNFMPALNRLGKVVLFDSFSRADHPDFSVLNRALLQTVLREDPDLIFCVLMGYEVWLETIQLLREHTRAALLNWSTDDSWKYQQFSRFVAPLFDVYATTSEQASEWGRRDGFSNMVLSQWAANSGALQPPTPATACRYAVSFVGTAYGNRPRWIRALAQAGLDPVCFGHGWPRGPVKADMIPAIFRDSVISLNFGDSGLVWNGVLPQRSRQIKARTFEVAGAGGFLLTENAPGLNRYFRPGEEVAVFTSRADLVDKIRYFLARPEERDRIAQRGHERVRQEHTYELRFAELIAKARERRGQRPAASGSAETLWRDFETFAACHRITAPLAAVKWCLEAPSRLVWGNRRGSRAARRIVHELSWRLAGRHTYTAAGWPGRMFYRES
jgi:spore maturation protein CgeB